MKFNKNISSKVKMISIVLIVILTSGLVYTYTINNSKTSKSTSEIRVDKLDINNRNEVVKSFTIRDEKNLNNFINAINKKVKLYSKIDIRNPDYNIELVIKNKTNEEYNLWVGENTKGILMSDKNVWELSTDSTTRLKNILESKE